MPYDKDFPKFLWLEACNTTVYIQNKVPHRASGEIALEEPFSGKKPVVNHFRIFGSMAYFQVLDEKHTKLDQTVERGHFVGYSKTSNTYRIYVPSSRKIIVRWDVKFVEEGAFKKSRKMPTDDQIEPAQAPLVQQQEHPLEPLQGQSQGSSIVTSTSMSSGAGDPVVHSRQRNKGRMRS